MQIWVLLTKSHWNALIRRWPLGLQNLLFKIVNKHSILQSVISSPYLKPKDSFSWSSLVRRLFVLTFHIFIFFSNLQNRWVNYKLIGTKLLWAKGIPYCSYEGSHDRFPWIYGNEISSEYMCKYWRHLEIFISGTTWQMSTKLNLT